MLKNHTKLVQGISTLKLADKNHGCTCVCVLFQCSQNGWFFIGGLYSGAQNSTITNVYWLNNFDNILQSYGNPLYHCYTCSVC